MFKYGSLSIIVVIVGVAALYVATQGVGMAPPVRPATSTQESNPISSSTPPSTTVQEEPHEQQIQTPPVPTVHGISLDLSNQNLTQVPNDVFARTDLVSLDVSHNRLTGALQAEVRHLRNLEWLNLSHNQFTGVPAEVGQLSELRYLDLSYNQLTGLPYELGNLKKLEVLDLTGNAYSRDDLAKIQEGLPALVQIIGD